MKNDAPSFSNTNAAADQNFPDRSMRAAENQLNISDSASVTARSGKKKTRAIQFAEGTEATKAKLPDTVYSTENTVLDIFVSEERQYSSASLLDEAAAETPNDSPPPSNLVAFIDVLETAQAKTATEMIMRLQEGAAAELSENDLEAIRAQSTKPARSRLLKDFERTNDLGLLSQMRQVGLIDKVLEIYGQAAKAVRQAQGKGKADYIEVDIYAVTGLIVNLMKVHHPPEMSVLLKSDAQHFHGSLQTHLQPMEISLPSGEIGANKEQCVKFGFWKGKDGNISVDLMVKSSAGETIVVGNAGTTVSNLSAELAARTDASIALEIEPTQGNCLAQGAVLWVFARRQEAFQVINEQERQEAIHSTKKALRALQLFNKDLLKDSSPQTVTASNDIRVGGESLLHAAIRLTDVSLVEQLIGGGADVKKKTVHSDSPLELAKKMTLVCTGERMAELVSVIGLLTAMSDNGIILPTLCEAELPNLQEDGRVELPAALTFDKHLGDTLSPAFKSLASASLQETGTCAKLRALPPRGPGENLTWQAPGSSNVVSLRSFHVERGGSSRHSRSPQPTLGHRSFPKLPGVRSSWVLHQHALKSRCGEQETSGAGCTRRHSASGCQFIHVHKPWGSRLESLFEQSGGYEALTSDVRRQIAGQTFYLDLKDSAYQHWHTAKYCSVRFGETTAWQDVVFAEGGDSCRNNQGVHWYRSKSEARQALEKATFVTFWAIENGHSTLPGILGPHLLLDDGCTAKRTREDANISDSYYTNNKRVCPAEIATEKKGVAASAATRFVRLSGLPFKATKETIESFFTAGNLVCETIVMHYGSDGRPSGLAYASFRTPGEAQESLALNYEYVGDRYVTVDTCSKSDFERNQRLEDARGN